MHKTSKIEIGEIRDQIEKQLKVKRSIGDQFACFNVQDSH
jgi:hypothetical protein